MLAARVLSAGPGAARLAGRSPVPCAPVTLRRAITCRATEGEDNDFESLFAKELKRRGLEEKAAAEASSSGASSSSSSSNQPPKKDPFQSSGASAGAKTRARAPPPGQSFEPEDDQRKRSILLVNEGLEGLFPRAKELLRLGGSVFLGFLPFMLAFSLLFTGIFAVFGDNFVHGGRPGTGPKNVDPQELLSSPTVDPYVPYYDR